MKYCMFAVNNNVIFNMAFCLSTNHLYAALVNRAVPNAIVYSIDDWKEAKHLSEILQNTSIDTNTDESKPIYPIVLPNYITEELCLKSNAAEVCSMDIINLNVTSNAEWAISALNGFCTAGSDEELCQYLSTDDLKYPIAVWSDDHESAVILARNSYVKRFYSRYFYDAEQTLIPQQWLDYFKDPYFEEREKRRDYMSKEFIEFQKKKQEIGW